MLPTSLWFRRKHKAHWWLVLPLLLSGCAPVTAPAAEKAPALDRIVLTGATLVDGTGREPIRDATVVLAGDRIEEVLAGGVGPTSYPEARIIPLDGKYLLPGLIDGHVHMLGWTAPLHLAHGVTSVIDSGNWTPWILATRFAIESGLLQGPRIFSAGGQIDRPPGTFQHSINVSTPQQARAVVQQHARLGVNLIKAYTMLTPPLLEAIIDEAHAHGLAVKGHITVGAREAASFGIDALEHMSGVAISLLDDPDKEREVTENRSDPAYVMASVRELAHLMKPELFGPLIEFMVRQKTAITPTLVSWWMGVHPHNAEYEAEDLALLEEPGLSFLPDLSRQSILSRHSQAARDRSHPRFEEGYRKTQRFIREFVAAGGRVIAGSDSTLQSLHGMDLHRELELLTDSGMTPLEVIRAATQTPARILLRREDLGTVEPGSLADLIVVGADPLKDIRNTRHIEMVIQGGRILDTAYDPEFMEHLPRPITPAYLKYFEERQ